MRALFDDLFSAFMVDLWLYKATYSTYRVSRIPGTLVGGAVLNNCTGMPAMNKSEYRVWETGIASISLPWAPSLPQALRCCELLGGWILNWIRNLMRQQGWPLQVMAGWMSDWMWHKSSSKWAQVGLVSALHCFWRLSCCSSKSGCVL